MVTACRLAGTMGVQECLSSLFLLHFGDDGTVIFSVIVCVIARDYTTS